MAGTVLHCIPGMGGGGAERQLAYLANPLITRGWTVHVALVSGGPNLPRLQQSGATIHRLRTSGSYDPRLASQIRALIRRLCPDIVQAWFVQMEVLAGTAARFARVPWILSERSSLLAYPSTWKNRLRVYNARTAAAIVANSAGGEEYWRARTPGVPRFIIPNAVPLDEIDAVRPALPPGLQVRSDQTLVLIAGRIDREKNIDRIFEACRLIVRRPNTSVVICGEGPIRLAIRETIAREGLADRIHTPGYVESIWAAMKRASVILSANTFEGRPNAVLEAMASGRPLVVSDIPAHRELLDDSSAFWADPHSPRSIADAVCRALDHPAESERCATAARIRAAGWSVDAAGEAYGRVYRTIVTGRKASE